jgi:hypothetical protein
VYVVNVPSNQRIIASLIAPDGGSTAFDSVFDMVTSEPNCGITTAATGTVGAVCSSGIDDPQPQTLSYDNYGAAADVYLIVDGYSSGVGEFGVAVRFSAIPSTIVGADTCGMATVIQPNTTYISATDAGTSSYAFAAVTQCRATNAAPDKTYSLTVPAMNRATISVVPNSAFDPSVNVVAGSNCGTPGTDGGTQGSVCAVGSASFGAGTTETMIVNNVSTSASTYTIVVDSNTTTASATSGAFEISSALTALNPLLNGGETCGAPITLDAGIYSGTTVGAVDQYAFAAANGCRGSADGGDVVYAINVPAASRGTLVLSSLTAGYAPALNVVNGAANCGGGALTDGGVAPAVCVGNNSLSSTVTVMNTGATAAPYLVVIDSLTTSTLPAGAYELSYATSAIPAGDSCTAPAVLAPNATTSDTFAGSGPDHTFSTAAGCRGTGTNGNDRAYSVTVAAGQRLQVTFTPGAGTGIDAVLNLVNATTLPAVCGVGAACLASADSTFSNGVESLTYDNTGATSQTLYLVASAYGSATASGAFGIATTVGAIPAAPAGDTCGAAIVAASGTVNYDLATFAANHTAMGNGTSCSSYSGNDIAYSVVMAAGQTLTVSAAATPTAADLVVNIVPSPATNCSSSATTCLGTADNLASTTSPEVATYTSTAGETVYVVVSRWDTGSAAGTVTFALAP